MTTKYMVVIVTEDERLAKAVYRAYAENEEEAKEEGGVTRGVRSTRSSMRGTAMVSKLSRRNFCL